MRAKTHFLDFLIYILLIILGAIGIIYFFSTPTNIAPEENVQMDDVTSSATLAPTKKSR